MLEAGSLRQDGAAALPRGLAIRLTGKIIGPLASNNLNVLVRAERVSQ